MPAADFNPSHDHPNDAPRSYRAAWLSVGLAFALAASLWGWHLNHPDAPPQATPPHTDFPWERAAPVALVDGGASGAARAASAGAVAPTAPVQTDANGHLIPTRALREWFDAELRRAGPRLDNLSSVRKQLLGTIQTRLTAQAAQEALALFDRYVNYGRALQAQIRADQARGPDGGSALDADMARLYAIESLRSHYFLPTESAALFGDDLLWERYRVTRQQTLSDHTIALIDKARRLNQLRADLPTSPHETARSANVLTDLDLLTTQWRARQGSADELHAVREELIGAPATAALEAQQARDQPWSQQLTRFGEQIKAVMNDPALSDAQRRDTIERLRRETLQALPPEYRASAPLKP